MALGTPIDTMTAEQLSDFFDEYSNTQNKSILVIIQALALIGNPAATEEFLQLGAQTAQELHSRKLWSEKEPLQQAFKRAVELLR